MTFPRKFLNDLEHGRGRIRYFLFIAGLAVILLAVGFALSAPLQARIGALAGYFPYLLLLLCPLIHVFMHHGHGRDKHHEE